MAAGRYFDGRSSRAHPVEVTAGGGALRLVGDGVDRTVEATKLRFTPATGLGPARLAFAEGGQCEIADRQAAAAIFASLGHRPSLPERLGASMSRALIATAAFLAFMAALYVWGVPIAANLVVTWLPHGVDESIGASTLRTLDAREFFRTSRLPVTRRADLVERFHALRMPTDDGREAPMVTLEFRRFGVPNAFALPGGVVVVSDEIIALAPDDDAILTVLAHEAGHVAHRDSMHQIVRATFTSFLAAWYFGDVSTAAATIAGGIGSLRYSRDAEHEADLYALATMKANGVSTKSAAELFRRLETWTPPPRPDTKKGGDDQASGKAAGKDAAAAKDKADAKAAPKDQRKRPRLELPVYLSTHPATEARIRLFETGKVEAGAAD
jgi:Zn-dependent protease with chaperone function